MASVEDLLTANLLGVFNVRDGAARRRAIESTYTEDVVFTDPDGPATGYDELDRRAGALLDGAPPEFVFVTDGPPYVGADVGALAWAFGPPGAPVARGVDVITVRDGRISALQTLLTAQV